jgi:hypothetical protein
VAAALHRLACIRPSSGVLTLLDRSPPHRHAYKPWRADATICTPGHVWPVCRGIDCSRGCRAQLSSDSAPRDTSTPATAAACGLRARAQLERPARPPPPLQASIRRACDPAREEGPASDHHHRVPAPAKSHRAVRVTAPSESLRCPSHRTVRVAAPSESLRRPSCGAVRVAALSESLRRPSHRAVRIAVARLVAA